jgi:hypothetical protein
VVQGIHLKINGYFALPAKNSRYCGQAGNIGNYFAGSSLPV